MIEDRLLGFDVREAWLEPDDLWTEERRDRFLLSVDVPKPLSTDTMVWPSVFDTGQGIGFSDAEREHLHLASVSTPAWIGPNGGQWENLETMQRYLAGNWSEPQPHARDHRRELAL